jgi:hypothetical protein
MNCLSTWSVRPSRVSVQMNGLWKWSVCPNRVFVRMNSLSEWIVCPSALSVQREPVQTECLSKGKICRNELSVSLGCLSKCMACPCPKGMSVQMNCLSESTSFLSVCPWTRLFEIKLYALIVCSGPAQYLSAVHNHEVLANQNPRMS